MMNRGMSAVFFHAFFDLGTVGPAGALTDAQYFRKLVRGNTSVRTVYKEDHVKSFIDGQSGILQNGVCGYRFFITTP
jgi:hypothetical protein